MKTFTIGRTRSRAALALVCAATVAAATAMAIGGWGAEGPAYLSILPPAARSAWGVLVMLLLGMLVLSGMVTSTTFWQLTEEEICCRSVSVSSGWLRYTWDVLSGREPEVDIRIATADVARVELGWEGQVVTTPWTRGIPMVVYPLTVGMTLADGSRVYFYNLERDVATLGRALRYLVEERGVALDDPDKLLAHMGDTQEGSGRLGTYLDSLYRGYRGADKRQAERADNVRASTASSEGPKGEGR